MFVFKLNAVLILCLVNVLVFTEARFNTHSKYVGNRRPYKRAPGMLTTTINCGLKKWKINVICLCFLDVIGRCIVEPNSNIDDLTDHVTGSVTFTQSVSM